MPLTILFNFRFILLASLTMAFGWGWRGDYGHEPGAMLPGALVAMAICLASGRKDWWELCPVIGLFGALGWAFGGSMSYGQVLGYTKHIEFWNVFYGFASIFFIGALWGAVGGAFLGIALTQRKSVLNSFSGIIIAILILWGFLDYSGISGWITDHNPVAIYDVDWAAAVSALLVSGIYLRLKRESYGAKIFLLVSSGWIVGFAVLTLLFGLRMTPPRSDNWSGMIGILIVLLLFLKKEKNYVALSMSSYGGLWGGIGFSFGALFLTVGAVSGIPIDWWKIMEQTFGLLMGCGIALNALRLIKGGYAPVEEEHRISSLTIFSYAFIFVFFLWRVLHDNMDDWFNNQVNSSSFVPVFFGIPTWIFIYVFGFGLTVLVLWIILMRRKTLVIVPPHPLGKAQLFFLIILWMVFIGDVLQKMFFMNTLYVFFTQFCFSITVLIITWLVLSIPLEEQPVTGGISSHSEHWIPGWQHRLVWLAVPVMILLLATIATGIHDVPLPGSSLRF